MSGEDDCRRCASRREFLDGAGRSLAGALVLPILADALEWLPVLEATGVARGGTERAYPLAAQDSVTIDKKGEVIVVRWQQRAYAFNLACPHENTALKWRDKDKRFQCPKHDSKYTPDGAFRDGRATRNMDRFAIRQDGPQLLVDISRVFKSDQQPREWAAAVAVLQG